MHGAPFLALGQNEIVNSSKDRMVSMARSSRRGKAAPVSLQRRLAKLRQHLRGAQVDALLVTNPVDIRYLTGFIGDDSWAVVPCRSGRVYVLSDFRFEEQIFREAPQVVSVMRQGSLADELTQLCRRTRIRRIGLQRDHTTLSMRKALVKKIGAKRLRDLDDGLIHQRAIKDSTEVRLIRRALSIQQQAFRETCRFMKVGMTENEVCAYLEYQMRTLGADGPGFPSIVAADANAALPHAIPGKRRIKKNGIVLIDWGAKFQGYAGDLTRVVALGKMKPKLRDMYRVVLDAQLSAIECIGPGKRLRDIDAVARDIIQRAGYGRHFGHGLGHGLGLDVHEQPVLSRRSAGELEEGHVVTVEPGIYLPGIGGIRIEDDVLVTSRGRTVLSDLPKSLESTMI